MRQIYGKSQPIPAYVFGIVWTLLYVCIVLSGYFAFFSGISTNDKWYLLRFIFFVINIFLNKFWSVIFFDMGLYRWQSILTIVSMLATGILYLVFVGISLGLAIDQSTAEVPYLWASFWLYVVYMLWCAVALVLNIRFKPSEETLPILKLVESRISSGKLKKSSY
jgi:tryptophan-rich sensory protein